MFAGNVSCLPGIVLGPHLCFPSECSGLPFKTDIIKSVRRSILK